VPATLSAMMQERPASHAGTARSYTFARAPKPMLIFVLIFGTVYAVSPAVEMYYSHTVLREDEMNQELTTVAAEKETKTNGSLLLGTGLALASMILIPALATRIGLGASLTGALRIAMMKASNQALRG